MGKINLNAALILSLLFHGLFVLYVMQNSDRPSLHRKGVVAIDFIEAIQHQRTGEDTIVMKQAGLGERKKVREKPEPSRPSQGQKGEIGDPNAVERESDHFIDEIARLVDRNKIYPQEAVDREEEGKVLVALTLDRSGALLESKVEKASPFELLNGAALKTVRKIAKFPAVPEILPAPIHLHIPLIFKIER